MLPSEEEQRVPCDAKDLLDKGWYHGPITRISAELNVAKEGDFLVRDCISSPGNFVLTCRWNGQVLHFRLNKLVSPELKMVEFQFEEECFPSVSELILFYLNNRRPISQLSGALIERPVFKEATVNGLSNGYYASLATKATNENHNRASKQQENNPSYYFGETNDYFTSDKSTIKRRTKLSSSVKRARQSQSMILVDQYHFPPSSSSPFAVSDSHNSGRKLRHSSSLRRPKSSELLTPNRYSREVEFLTFSTFKRSPSESCLSPAAPTKTKHNNKNDSFPKDIDFSGSPNMLQLDDDDDSSPPKTSSLSPTYDIPQKPRSCLTEKQLRGNGFYDQPRQLGRHPKLLPPPPPSRTALPTSGTNQSPHQHKNGTSISNTKADLDNNSLLSEPSNTDTSYLEHRELTPLLSSEDNDSMVFDCSSLPGEPFPGPEIEVKCLFHPSQFRSKLLFVDSRENKALEPTAILACHKILLSHSASYLAKHLTWIHLDFFSIKMDRDYPGLPDITSGIHLVTLVDGRQFRLDVIERFLCLRQFVLITIFSGVNMDQAVEILGKWIDIADETVNANGDLFGLSSVVSALCNAQLKQVGRLWTQFKAQSSEKWSKLNDKLLPLLKTWNNLEKSRNGNFTVDVSVPHLIPFISGCKDLRELKLFRRVYKDFFDYPEPEENEKLFQMHLEQLQADLNNLEKFKLKGEQVMGDFSPERDVLDIFSTDFHLRLLWGSKNAVSASSEERHAKFERVISALAKMCDQIYEKES